MDLANGGGTFGQKNALHPPLLFPVARIAPLFPMLLIALLLRPAAPATGAIAPSPAG
jgi:alpha-1,2-mannosyltransferase